MLAHPLSTEAFICPSLLVPSTSGCARVLLKAGLPLESCQRLEKPVLKRAYYRAAVEHGERRTWWISEPWRGRYKEASVSQQKRFWLICFCSISFALLWSKGCFDSVRMCWQLYQVTYSLHFLSFSPSGMLHLVHPHTYLCIPTNMLSEMVSCCCGFLSCFHKLKG